MSRHANPTLIGAFVLGALALGTIAVLLLAGGRWFQERRQYVLYFDGAAQGLQVGAPVVLLGVKVGSVKKIQLGLDRENASFHGTGHHRAGTQYGPFPDRGKDQPASPEHHPPAYLPGPAWADSRSRVCSPASSMSGLDFYPDKPPRFISHDPSVSRDPDHPDHHGGTDQ